MITGACRSGLAEYLTNHLRSFVDDNKSKMAIVVDEAAELITGLKSKDHKWEWCVLQNSSAPGGVKWSCPTDAA